MKLQQLIVDASSVSDRRQNVLVAKSSKIKEELIEQAIQWSAVGSDLLKEQESAVFYCRSRAGTGMVGRSYPSCLNRNGERLTRTHWVLVSSNQMKCYYNNAVLIIRNLNSSGHWILQTSSCESELPELELADCPVNTFAYRDQEQFVDLAKQAVEVHGQVAIPDAVRPLDFVGQVLRAHSLKERAKINFSVDRRVAAATLFHVSAFSGADIRLEHELRQSGVFPLRQRSEPVRS